MRKFLFGLLAIVLWGAPSIAQNTNPPLIQLEFGRKSQNCGGFGICVFRVNATVEDVINLVTVFMSPKSLLMMKMSPTFYKNHIGAFPNGNLVVEEDFVLDPETARAIGATAGYTIKTGQYKVVFDKSTNTYNCTF
jgi:hypothetical protein